jgi:hypothetical protein
MGALDKVLDGAQAKPIHGHQVLLSVRRICQRPLTKQEQSLVMGLGQTELARQPGLLSYFAQSHEMEHHD